MSELKEPPKSQRKSHTSMGTASLESDSKLSPTVVNSLPGKNSSYAYENQAYDGRLSSVSDVRSESREQLPPPTCVVREQYWACSKWPRAQRLLAITVGVLVGAIVGLAVIVVIRGSDGNGGTIIEGLLRATTAPD